MLGARSFVLVGDLADELRSLRLSALGDAWYVQHSDFLDRAKEFTAYIDNVVTQRAPSLRSGVRAAAGCA